MTTTNTTSLRFYYNGIKAAPGAKLERVWYSGSANLIFIYARECSYFSRAIREALTVTNDSDIMTDYFESDRIRLEPSHPCFAAAFAALQASEAHVAARRARNAARQAQAAR